MNRDDFRYMWQRKQILDLKKTDLKWLEPVLQQGCKKERALLILHGFSSSPAVYRYLIPKLKCYDAILCPVLPGHADSIEAFSQSTASHWQAKANQICQELVSEYKCVDVLGISLGGLLALNLSHLYHLNGLFLLAPALKLQGKLSFMIRLTKILQGLGFQDLRNMAGNLVSSQYSEIAYRKLPLKVILEILNFINSYQELSPRCPVDLFLGLKDEVVASYQVERLFSASANVMIHWLNNSAHLLPLDNDLDQIVDCIHSRALSNLD